MWATIGLNTGIPPVLMIIVSLFIRVPGKDNSMRILSRIRQVLFENDPKLSYELRIRLHPPRNSSLLMTVFAALWIIAFIISFGLIIYLLNILHFNIVSQFIFVFFITIVSFLSYRINSVAHMYMIDGKQGLLTPFIDFLFIPVVRVGMKLTEGISQINFVIFIFDFLIEAPFKAIFGFFEQWFSYMHTKREDLG